MGYNPSDFSGLTLLIPFITVVITHLLSGMSHQVEKIDPLIGMCLVPGVESKQDGVRLPSAKRALSSWLLAAAISARAKRSAGLAQGVRSAQLLRWSFDGSKKSGFFVSGPGNAKNIDVLFPLVGWLIEGIPNRTLLKTSGLTCHMEQLPPGCRDRAWMTAISLDPCARSRRVGSESGLFWARCGRITGGLR